MSETAAPEAAEILDGDVFDDEPMSQEDKAAKAAAILGGPPQENNGEADEEPQASVEKETVAPEQVSAVVNLQRIGDLERQAAAAWMEYESAKETVKELRARFDGIIAEMRKAARSATEYLPLIDGPKPAEAAEEPQADAPPAWEEIPLDAIVKYLSSNTKGFGGAKEVALRDRCKTAKDVEDLRAGDGFQSLKGWGKKLSEAFENAWLDWLTKNRDSEAFAEAKDGAADDPQPAEEWR